MKNKATTSSSLLFSRDYLSHAVWLTVIYLILSITWILLSDRFASLIAGSDNAFFLRIQSLKGLLFVSVSGLLLFFVSKNLNRNLSLYYQQKESLQKKYDALNDAAREGIFDYDLLKDKATTNKKMSFFFPAEGNEIDGFWETYKRTIHPSDVNRVINEFQENVRSNKQSWLVEFRLRGSDGKYYNVISNSYIIRNPYSNEPMRLIGAIQDISELRNLQSEYFEEKLLYKKELAASIIRAQEMERDRWAKELHDNVCQILSVASMYTSEICLQNNQAPVFAPEVKKLIGESINEIRKLSSSIKTPSFKYETLIESIDKLTADVRRFCHFEFSLSADSFDESLLCHEMKLMIYRIVQEQITNICKYASATHVNVSLAILNNTEVHVTVRDDGKGFDPSKVKTGIGLRNIESRLQVYAGRLNIRSAPGKGCMLQAQFNL
mgnify:CR=1 FL=1